ncbi:TrgA family protein [Algirhabdus cladophorae]|uniref:TrgA family protein n=1 Tax=Algirhabdus cladophorae TaxID=3377108 RepID=UPI003B84AE34
MPTAARLVAALLFAALGWYVSEMVKALLPPEENVGWFSEANTIISFFIGWVFVGKRAGDTYAGALGYGITAALLMVLWCAFLQAFYEMIEKSLRKQYDDPVEAVVAIFEIMIERGPVLINPFVVGTLLFGAMIIGLIVEWVGRRFA